MPGQMCLANCQSSSAPSGSESEPSSMTKATAPPEGAFSFSRWRLPETRGIASRWLETISLK